MPSIKVNADISYEVHIGLDWKLHLHSLVSAHKKVLIVAPATVINLGQISDYAASLNIPIFETPDAENQKDFATVERLWNLLGELEFGRTDAIIAIGGGATTDLAGFAAATWLRGISWYAIPTTLAGMVDASIDGKTGIYTSAGKNLVGSFYSPKSVCIDTSWLTSLSDRDFSAGLAEVIKTGFIKDPSIVELLTGCTSLDDARTHVQILIEKSVAVKAEVVSADFKEGKLREILNFGHTLGHALEKSAGYSLRHGEAVSIGLHYAAHLSQESLGLDPVVVASLVDLLAKFNLPTRVDSSAYSWDELLASMAGDKKSRDGRIRFIGIRAVGEVEWIESSDPALLARCYEKIVL